MAEVFGTMMRSWITHQTSKFLSLLVQEGSLLSLELVCFLIRCFTLTSSENYSRLVVGALPGKCAAPGLLNVVFKTNNKKPPQLSLWIKREPESEGWVHSTPVCSPTLMGCVGSGFSRQKEDSDLQCVMHILAVHHRIKGTPRIISAFYWRFSLLLFSLVFFQVPGGANFQFRSNHVAQTPSFLY